MILYEFGTTACIVVFFITTACVCIYCTMVVGHTMWGNDLLGEGLCTLSAFLVMIIIIIS